MEKKLNFEFECIYSGFLASHRQVGEVNKYIDAYPEAIIVVDPVMGDEGEIYKTVDEELEKQYDRARTEGRSHHSKSYGSRGAVKGKIP